MDNYYEPNKFTREEQNRVCKMITGKTVDEILKEGWYTCPNYEGMVYAFLSHEDDDETDYLIAKSLLSFL